MSPTNRLSTIHSRYLLRFQGSGEQIDSVGCQEASSLLSKQICVRVYQYNETKDTIQDWVEICCGDLARLTEMCMQDRVYGRLVSENVATLLGPSK